VLKVLDLFSGIGGFSLGLERAGMKTVAFCEIEEFPRKVLRKHWPEVPIYEDVRTLTAARLAADGIGVDVICGGFPCQDISNAGKRAGIEGERSGLWSEYARLIGEIRPQFVIVENVAALLGRGLSRVLGDLAEVGYDAEWHCIPASYVGAPHRRDRLWIVAHAWGAGGAEGVLCDKGNNGFKAEPGWAVKPIQSGEAPLFMAHTGRIPNESQRISGVGAGSSSSYQGQESQWERVWSTPTDSREDVADSNSEQRERNERTIGIIAEHADFSRSSWWESEPQLGRVANGVPSRVDRLKGLGNAVVPQIPEIIGKAIMEALHV